MSYGLIPGTLDPGIQNPVGLSGAAASTARAVATVTDWTGLPAMLLCAVALGVRMHGSRGVERAAAHVVHLRGGVSPASRSA